MTRSNRSARAAGTLILAIDPGHTESGWVLIDGETCQPLEFGKTPNAEVLDLFRRGDLLLADPLPIVQASGDVTHGRGDRCAYSGQRRHMVSTSPAALYDAWRIRCCDVDEFRGWYEVPMPYGEQPGLGEFCGEAEPGWCVRAAQAGKCSHRCNVVKLDDIEEVTQMAKKPDVIAGIIARLEPYTVDPESARRWREHLLADGREKREPLFAGREV